MAEQPIAPSSGKVAATMPRALKIVMMVFGALIVFAIVFAGTSIVVLMQDPEKRKLLTKLRDGFGVVMEGMQAPGTEALREAGCSVAMVMDMPRLAQLAGDVAGKADLGERAASMTGQPFVMCVLQRADPEVTCEHLASVYVGAVDSTPGFGLAIQVEDEEGLSCHGLFDAGGRRTRDLDPTRGELADTMR